MRIEKEPFSKCNFDRGLQKSPNSTPFVLSFVQMTAVELCPSASPGSSRACLLREQAHLERVLLLDASRERPPKRDPCSCPRSSSSPPPPRERAGCESGPGSNTITHRPPRTCVLHIADHLRGRAGWGCKGDRECRSGVEEGWDALPPRKIPAAGCIAEPWGRPDSGAYGDTRPSEAPGPVTLTTRSHRRRSPPGTGSGNARAPPRWSCSAPAGRTWASPETSSSGGRGARRWPLRGPACTRTRFP